jgi:ribokinase
MPKPQKPLVVVGSVNADLYVEIPRLPLPGETLAGDNAAMRPGGKGGNQAGAAARLGQETWFVGQVGDDAYAAPLSGALSAAGVKLGLLATSPGATGQALILLQPGGENSIVIVGGANRRWSAPPAAAEAQIDAAGALLLQREVPEAVNLAAARRAAAAGVPVVLDAGGDDGAVPAELLPLLAVLSPNESELARLTGLPTTDDAQVLAAARALQARGVGTVLVKLGGRGCLLVPPAPGVPVAQPAFRVPVVDTTGAGDCFTAAYVVALMEGRMPLDRLAFACAAAALCVQVKGALPSMPARAAVDAFLAERA